MTLAADTLFVTKDAVSQALAELESQLGVCLFDRQNTRLSINGERRELVQVAQVAGLHAGCYATVPG